MPVICIGPVCVPWTCVPAIVFFFWRFAKPLLPKAVADVIEDWGSKVAKVCQPYIDKIPFMRKSKKNKKKPEDVVLDFQLGKVNQLTSEAQWDLMLKKSVEDNFDIILDFTATWCGPCQRLKPIIHELVEKYSKVCFMEVDADNSEELRSVCAAKVFPTIQVYKQGKKTGHWDGLEADDLTKFWQDQLDGKKEQ
eukprot:TRINITY_DN74837_c0_g1_i1.p1 TRINITY_DN74837_c0_g1~~TRINITY_DN74837_c0_g1_i1.p1  ORF type:complete len:194 (-),score=41.19 TRINITY_DN74837_c0_g1_i1:114-695(-)